MRLLHLLHQIYQDSIEVKNRFINGLIEYKALVLSFLAFWIKYAYLYLPQTNILEGGHIIFRPDVQISKEGHVYYMCERVSYMIWTLLVFFLSDKFKRELLFFFFIQILFLFDYWFFYGETRYDVVAATLMTLTILKVMVYDRYNLTQWK